MGKPVWPHSTDRGRLMRMMRRRSAALTFLAIGAGAVMYLYFRGPFNRERREVDKLFADWNRRDSPGCAVGVGRNGSAVLTRAYGMSSIELGVPIAVDSVFPAASISKQFTAMSILLLAKQGKLSLDDPVQKYVPGMPEYEAPITLRHLLNHTSGLRDGFGLEGWASPREDGDRNDRIAWFLARQKGLNFATGSRFQYNNGAYNLLGTIVKRVSGQSLRKFAEANIFEPLGMTRTHFQDTPSDMVEGLVSGYVQHAQGWSRGTEIPGTVGNAGLQTTVEDLLRWAQNFAEPRVGDTALIEAMLTPTTLTNGEKVDYAFGVNVGHYRGSRVIEHGGGDQGISTYLAMFPEHGLAVAVLCNSDAIPSGALETRIADIYLGNKLKPIEATTSAAAPKSVSLPANQLERETGWYGDSSKSLLRVVADGGKLTVRDVEGDDIPFEMIPIGEHEFVVSAGGIPMTRVVFAGTEMRVTPFAGGSAQVFAKLNTTTLSVAELQAFSGEFRSEELDSIYKVEAQAGKLMMVPYGRPKIVLDATGPDTFTGSGTGVVRFSRNGRGLIDGFTLNRSLAEGVRFQRVK